ncbi:MAG: hypothetical protein JXA52_03110 [Planctomycetes bacterium]|nr:hypothetical protein [Planctomycetota bacterium]
MTGSLGKRAERVALGGFCLTLIGMFIMWYVAYYCNSISARAELFHLLAATLVWGISTLHLRAQRQAEDEKAALDEAERLRIEQGKPRLFDREEGETGIAQVRLKDMERWGGPIATIIIIVLQLFAGGYLLYALANLDNAPGIAALIGITPFAELSNTTFAGAAAFALAFFCFALGKYAAGMSRDKQVGILRAGAGYTISCALICFIQMIAYAMAYTGWLTGEKILSWLIPIILLAMGLEMAINLVLDFYRPRIRGKEPRPIYDSRLTGLLAEPQGLFKTFAHTMDYQLGFKVSETWFFQFLNHAIAPLILFQLLSLYLLTCILVVQPGEVAVIELWGRPRGIETLPPAPLLSDSAAERAAKEAAWDNLQPPLEPGLHLKWPWPIEITRRVPCELVQEIFVGAPQAEGQDEPLKHESATPDVVSWDRVHTKDEFAYIMPLTREIKTEVENNGAAETPDVMFVSGAIAVHYSAGGSAADSQNPKRRIGDIYRYLYRFDDAKAAMISLSEREVTNYMAGANFWNVLVDKVKETEKDLTRRIQQAADRAGIGVRVVFVSLSNVHPPVGEVGKAFQEVVSAREKMFTIIHQANAQAAQIRASWPGKAQTMINEAIGYRDERVLLSEAESKRFLNQLTAFNAAPNVYLHRERMRAIEEGMESALRLTVVPPDTVAFFDAKAQDTAGVVGEALGKEFKNP